MNKQKILSWQEIARRGGEATKRKGKAHYRSIGKKGADKLKEKYGDNYFTEILPRKLKEARERRKKNREQNT